MGPYREKQTLVMVDGQGNLRDTIGDFLGDERIRLARSDGPLIFGRKLVAAIGEERIYVGQADSFYIEAFDFRRKQLGDLRRSSVVQKVTKVEIEAYMEEHLATVLDPAARESQRRGLETYDFPEVFPAYSSIDIDPLGYIWVRSYYAPSSPQDRWSVFTPGGQFVQEIAMPVNVELLHVGLDRVLARRTTPLGAHEVQVFRLLRAR
jgi:hypothetical protein